MATGPAAVIYKHFENLTDPRINRGKNHELLDLVFQALTATICGAQGWADVERFAKSKLSWFRQFTDLEHGVPSHDTFGRVFAVLSMGEFLSALHAWVDTFAGSLRGQGIAIDGKTLRGSFDRAASQSPLHTITAFACDTRRCLRQTAVDDKSNEIPAVAQALGTPGRDRDPGCHALPSRNSARDRGGPGRLPSDRQRQPGVAA